MDSLEARLAKLAHLTPEIDNTLDETSKAALRSRNGVISRIAHKKCCVCGSVGHESSECPVVDDTLAKWEGDIIRVALFKRVVKSLIDDARGDLV